MKFNTVIKSSSTFLLSSLITLSALANRTIIDDQSVEVTIPDAPKKILVVSEIDLDAMYALGMKPYGTTNGRGQNVPSRYLENYNNDLVIVGNFYQPDAEKILQVEPDLILAGGVPIPPVMAKLRQLAPTVATYSLGESWKVSFKKIANVLDKQAEHKAFMQKYDARVADIKNRLSEKNIETISIVRWNPKGPAYMLNQAFAVTILEELGLNRPKAQHQDGQAHSQPLSFENLHLIDADYLFIGTLDNHGESVDAMLDGFKSPAFMQLNAVKNKKALAVDGSVWTSLGGPIGAMQILDFIELNLL
ncbi:iron-siderophore ABC transporter substrate-binding protein [Marinicellulosiphila megalodicopiae]|uniref:iron-siderophore ABC transporter substrate-binding protein n=1 Tax=Marinicellulosiphila megalodicopiae TaxID=2724896 RepID=UPI003BB01CC7